MIYIIGAGPIGCYAAYLLAKKKDVRVFEEHTSIGTPVQCTGIVTHDIMKFIPKDSECIINKIDYAKIYAPNGKFLEVKFNKPDIILDREWFDQYFYNKAKKRGPKIRFYMGYKLIKITERTMVFQKGDKTVSYPLKKGDIVIGADGPLSKVRELLNEHDKSKSKRAKKTEFFFGWQYRLKTSNSGKVDFFPRSKSFSWIVPESNSKVRVGIFGKRIRRDNFINFVERFYPNYKKTLLESQGGLIPIYNPKQSVYKHIKNKRRDLKLYLLGDASTYVKATSGGGLVPGLRAARILKRCIKYNQNYNKELRKQLGFEMWLHLQAHKIFSRMDNEEWNRFIKIFSSKKIRKILGQTSRDNIRKQIFKLLMVKPSLVRYGLKLLLKLN
jgi:digeranylgeranylglycerophospholipid reductase